MIALNLDHYNHIEQLKAGYIICDVICDVFYCNINGFYIFGKNVLNVTVD